MPLSPSADIDRTRLADTIIRLCDFAIAAVMLVLAAVPMAAIAAAIKLSDGGPVLFLQPRVGKDRRPFRIAKFRTMTHDPNRAIGAASGAVTVQDRAAFQTTSAGDNRITKVGRFLRPVHLDELPQLLNVLAGDMSLVGVRPDVPVQEIEYTAQEWVDRHVVAPGITGWAQVSSTVFSMADRTAHDLYWVRHRSMGLYIKILLLTVVKVFKRNSL